MVYQYFKGRKLTVDKLVREEKLPSTLRFLEVILNAEQHSFTRDYRLTIIEMLIESMVQEGKIMINDPRYPILDEFCRRNLSHPAPVYVSDDVIYTPSLN